MAIKPEIIQNPKKGNENSPLVPETSTNDVIDVDIDKQLVAWENYQNLCKQLLNDADYQEYRDRDGNIKKFPKKSAWFKLGKAFNVCTEIVEKNVVRGKNGQVKEAYYRVRAYLPNGTRTVEADASCDIWEKGKGKSSGHDLRTTAETRATNRAISKLIGAGEVSAEEINNGELKKITRSKTEN